jgi:hypothetical protein
MTFPSGTGVFTGPYGPGIQSGGGSTVIAGGSSGISVVTTNPGLASNQVDGPYPGTDPATFNFANGITSTQRAGQLDTIPAGPQQGSAYLTNVSAACLAGYSPTGNGSASFVQVTGAFQSK